MQLVVAGAAMVLILVLVILLVAYLSCHYDA
jgi:hypothetical protein